MNNPLFGTFPEALNYSEKSTMLPLKMIGRESRRECRCYRLMKVKDTGTFSFES